MINTKFFSHIIPLLFFTFFMSCQSIDHKNQMPNVILIMADDIGYEGLSINGSTSYNTPFLDSLALNGINFTNALSQPLCTPSRVKIMTGKYNFRNYDHFTYLNSNQKTFGNLFKENGYKTAIVGKWQLNGLRIGDVDREVAEDNTRPYEFGFDEYSLWQLTKPKQYGERFANPLIEQNGNFLPRNENSYGPDIVSDYAVEFIKRNKGNPFFIYYPMLLVHDPFVPTPDSPEWSSLETRSTPDTRYFIDMVNYMDKIVGKIINELKQQGIFENTLLIFVGDNGTPRQITSNTINDIIPGGKGLTNKTGVNVPMVVSWPSKIKNNSTNSDLITFADFYSTFSDILGVPDESDGTSMMDIFSDNIINDREIVSIFYNPLWGQNRDKNYFSQTVKYKLYEDGSFFDIENDIYEKQPLLDENLTKNQLLIKEKLFSKIKITDNKFLNREPGIILSPLDCCKY